MVSTGKEMSYKKTSSGRDKQGLYITPVQSSESDMRILFTDLSLEKFPFMCELELCTLASSHTAKKHTDGFPKLDNPFNLFSYTL